PAARPGEAEREPGWPTAGPGAEGVRRARVAARRAGAGGLGRGTAGEGVGRDGRPVHERGQGDGQPAAAQARRPAGHRDAGPGRLPDPRVNTVPRPGPPPPPPPPPSGMRFRGPRRTVRLRLTALYVGLFLASAACLLVITYFLVAQQLPGTLSVRSITGGGTGAGTSREIVTGGTAGTSAITACAPPQNGTVPTAEQMSACNLAAQAEAAGLRRDTLDQLLIESGIALAIMAVVSVGLGWLMAGRVLSP